MMSIDETRQDNLSGKIEHHVGGCRKLPVQTDLFDEAFLDIDSGAFQLPALTVHGDQHFSIFGEEGRHGDVLGTVVNVAVMTLKEEHSFTIASIKCRIAPGQWTFVD